jgi:hypothetical protein
MLVAPRPRLDSFLIEIKILWVRSEGGVDAEIPAQARGRESTDTEMHDGCSTPPRRGSSVGM